MVFEMAACVFVFSCTAAVEEGGGGHGSGGGGVVQREIADEKVREMRHVLGM